MLPISQIIKSTLQQIKDADPRDPVSICLAYTATDVCSRARRAGADPVAVCRLENAATRLRQLSTIEYPGMM